MAVLSCEEMYTLVRSHGAEPGVDWAMCCAAKAESNWLTTAVGDNGHSVGLWMMHDQGLGAGLSVEERMNPDIAASAMLPHFREAYYYEQEQGQTGADLIVATCLRCEKPYEWDVPGSAAALNYTSCIVPAWPPDTTAPAPAEEPAVTAPGTTYDAEYPPCRQQLDWTCSCNAAAWAMSSLGYAITGPEMTERMQAAGLVTPEYGLMDGSGAQLAVWLAKEFGVRVEHAYPMTWEGLNEWDGRGPIMLGGQNWGHWSAMRNGDATGLRLANPAPNWKGVGDHMDKSEWDTWGQWAALHIPSQQGATTEEDAVMQEEIARLTSENEALAAQNAQLSTDLAAAQSYSGALGHDVLLPVVSQMDQALGSTVASQQWSQYVSQWVSVLRPHVIP